jgi:GMP synthase-like glutamine amidotransferase
MILVIDMNWKKDSLGNYEFVLPVLAVAEKMSKCTTRHYLEVTNQDLNQCSSIILSGTALKDTATLSQPEKFQWLKDIEKPVLGICAGMETIGTVFGVPLIKCLEIGMTSIISLSENPLFSADFKAYSLHTYCVEPSEEFAIWAKSAKCIQVIKHVTKPIYGTLFHPEVRNQEIIKSFIELSRSG